MTSRKSLSHNNMIIQSFGVILSQSFLVFLSTIYLIFKTRSGSRCIFNTLFKLKDIPQPFSSLLPSRRGFFTARLDAKSWLQYHLLHQFSVGLAFQNGTLIAHAPVGLKILQGCPQLTDYKLSSVGKRGHSQVHTTLSIQPHSLLLLFSAGYLTLFISMIFHFFGSASLSPRSALSSYHPTIPSMPGLSFTLSMTASFNLLPN